MKLPNFPLFFQEQKTKRHCFIVNEFSTRSTKEYEKSTDSVRGQLFQAKSQPNQERQSIFLDVIVNDFST